MFLPGSTFLEKDGTFTTAERRIQRVRRAMSPRNGYADWEITQLIAQAVGLEWAYTHPSQVMDEIARLTPTFTGVSYAKLDELGSVQWPCNAANPVGSPVMHAAAFTRQTRRTANVVWHEEDRLEIHPHDAEQRGVKDGDWVRIASRAGETALRALITDRVAPGVVYTTFHHPLTQANVITTAAVRDGGKTATAASQSDRIFEIPWTTRAAGERQRLRGSIGRRYPAPSRRLQPEIWLRTAFGMRQLRFGWTASYNKSGCGGPQPLLL